MTVVITSEGAAELVIANTVEVVFETLVGGTTVGEVVGVVVTPAAVEVVSVAVTGHTVVETAMVTVVSTVDSPGQFVTVAAQLVIV
jgi:hypothetical protein